ncbi:MAG: glycoside hydrolase family 88 protein [Tannerella sp.]|jgi:rhamnogalacturonyl hydrolase YesR|nr:glycoside hydrolase family 88 protein [Tannerella sp.]
MNIKQFFLIGMIACIISSCTTEESMNSLIADRLEKSAEQYRLMAESLLSQPGKLPRSFENDQLITSNSAWWCSGFMPGTLWYLYEYTNDAKLLEYAKTYTDRIEKEQYNNGTHDLGFMIYCSYGNGLRLTDNKDYIPIMMTGAESLATRYNPLIGCIQSWGANAKWQFPVIIDNMMNLEFLFWASKQSGDPKFRDICISHADKTIRNHYRPDFSSFHVVSYDTITGLPEKKNTHQGYNDESAWARGQAWGLYGYVMAYRETKMQRYLDQACKIAGFLLNHPNLPADKIPYWDFNAPDIPEAKRDASAGAIIASALIELSLYAEKEAADQYIRVAETQLRTLSSPEYFAGTGTNGHFILKHSTGHLPGNSEVDVPLTYADYYYIEALLRYKNRILKSS